MARAVPVSPDAAAGPRPEGAAAPVHPIVHVDYRIRVVGYLVAGAAVASTVLEQRPGARAVTALLWALLAAQTLLWPHAVFLLARRSRHPQRAEKVALALDGFLGGIWVTLIGLALWPSTVLTFTLLISAASIGGRRMLAACALALAAGGALAAVVAGFTFLPQTGLLTSCLCIAGILAYGTTHAVTLKRQARSIIAADHEKALLFDDLRERSGALARSLDRLQALHQVTTALSSSLDLPVVLDTVVRHAVRVAGADACAILEVKSGATVFNVVASRNLGPSFFDRLAAIQVDAQDRVIREAIDGKKPVEIPAVDTEQNFLLRDAALAEGFHGFLAVPIVQERITRGLLLLRRTPGAFDPDSVELLVALAAQSAIAIEHADLYRQLQTQRHSLEVASRAKSDFLANMSHELRTPLNAILGYTELMLDHTYGEVPARMHAVLQRVDRSARQLLALIDDVLDIARIEAGKLVLQRAPCALSDVIREVALAMEALAQEKGLRLLVRLPGENLPLVDADQRQLTQALFNLVGNAIKFTERGEVEIAALFDCQQLTVAVRDTGPGVAGAEQARIFLEFQQGDAATIHPRDGAGLGLAIARRIIELHGGRIWLDSQPGAGSTFSFTLPLAAPIAASGAGPGALQEFTA